MFVLSSPSGVGKTTLTKKLAANNSNFKISVSHTTRKPRSSEINEKDYYFVDSEEFDSLIKQDKFFEHAKIFNNFYGTLREPVLKSLSQGNDVLFDIDWQGTKQLKRVKNLSMVTFFILPPNLKVLKERLLNRHGGQEKLVKERMDKFNEELSHWDEYDYIIVNDNLEDCYNQLLEILCKSKEGKTYNQNKEEIKKKITELSM